MTAGSSSIGSALSGGSASGKISAVGPHNRNVSVIRYVSRPVSPMPLSRGDAMNRFLVRSCGMLGMIGLVLALCFAPTVFAQTDTGSMRGTVTDEQGGAVTGAQVTITNADTAY